MVESPDEPLPNESRADVAQLTRDMVAGPGEFDPQRTRHEAGTYSSRCAMARPPPVSSPGIDLVSLAMLQENRGDVVEIDNVSHGSPRYR